MSRKVIIAWLLWNVRLLYEHLFITFYFQVFARSTFLLKINTIRNNVTVHEKTRHQSKIAILRNAHGHVKVKPLFYFLLKSNLSNEDKVKYVCVTNTIQTSQLQSDSFLSAIFVLYVNKWFYSARYSAVCILISSDKDSIVSSKVTSTPGFSCTVTIIEGKSIFAGMVWNVRPPYAYTSL